MTTFNIFLVLIVIVCLLLALVIMVQNPKGGGLSSTFGGNTQVVGGVKKTGDSKLLDGSTPAAPINQLNQQAPVNNNATQQVPATPATSSNTGN